MKDFVRFGSGFEVLKKDVGAEDNGKIPCVM